MGQRQFTALLSFAIIVIGALAGDPQIIAEDAPEQIIALVVGVAGFITTLFNTGKVINLRVERGELSPGDLVELAKKPEFYLALTSALVVTVELVAPDFAIDAENQAVVASALQIIGSALVAQWTQRPSGVDVLNG
jgi:hypothetical protein